METKTKNVWTLLSMVAVTAVSGVASGAAEVWCSPSGTTKAAYTEADPGALSGVMDKIDTGTADAPSMIYLKSGEYSLTTKMDWRWKNKHYIITSETGKRADVVFRGGGAGSPAVGQLWWFNSSSTYVNRLKSVTFKDFVTSDAILYQNNGRLALSQYIEDCAFISNYGKGPLVYGGIVKDCHFEDNDMPEASKCLVCAAVRVEGCTFVNNIGSKGVNIDVYGPVSNCVFKGNCARLNGGAITRLNVFNYENIPNNPIPVEKCYFENNTAPNGGAVYNDGSNRCLVFRNCQFVNNSAEENNGVADIQGGTTFSNCVFVTNSAAGNNGVGQSDFIDCVFSNNTAQVDGGVFKGSFSTMIRDCHFVGNRAGRSYGCVYLAIGSVSNVWFEGNFALTNSAVGMNYRGNVTKGYNGVFIGNLSSNMVAMGSWYNSLFVSNRCEDAGLMFEGTGLFNCTVVNNYGIPSCAVASEFSNSIIVDNEPYDLSRGAYARYFNNVIYSKTDGGTYSPMTACIQVDSARAVGFYWNEDGRQPYWGLKKRSIARNKGNNAKLPAGIVYDLFGQGRIEGDIVDIGCYECWPVSYGLLLIVK